MPKFDWVAAGLILMTGMMCRMFILKKNNMSKIEKLKAEIESLEKEHYLISKKIQAKRRLLHKAEYGREDHLEFTVQWLVDGVIEGKRVEFDRGVSIYPHSFEWFLEYCMIVETLREASGTNIDLVIDRYAKKFKIGAEEKARLMQKYWHKKRQTIAEMVKTWSDQERNFYESEELFLQQLMYSAVRWFEYKPTEIKYGVLYYIFKYHQKGDFEELKKDIENVPEKIRQLVDSFFAGAST